MNLPYYIPYNISDHTSPVVLIQNTDTHTYSAVDVDFGDGIGTVSYLRDFNVIEYVYQTTGLYNLRLSAYYSGGVNVQVANINIYDSFKPYDTTTLYDYVSATTNNYKLPASRYQLAQSNDWVTADNINAAFGSIYTNLTYLENLCHRPDIRGSETIIAWLGGVNTVWTNYDYSLLGSNDNNYIGTNTNEIIQITTTDFNYLTAVGFDNIVDITVGDNETGNKIYLIDNTSVVILSSDINATTILSSNNIQFNKTFTAPNSIDIDSLNNIYVADPGNNEVYKFKILNNALVVQSSVGGLGSSSDKYRTNGPSQVCIDSTDRIIISDKNNYAIKIYDNLFTWVLTINTRYIEGKVIALAVDKQSDTIYTITDGKYLQKYSKTGSFLDSVKLDISPNILQCFIEYSGNYLYIVCTGIVYKYTRDGIFLKVAGVPVGDGTAANEVVAGCSDIHNQTFIASRTKVFRIDSTPPIINIKPYTPSLYYTVDDIKIQPKEGVEDWVYNKALNKLIHNHTVFARNIYASFIRGVTTSNTLQYFTVGTRGYDEILSFIPIDGMYIGMNEPVLVNVINRALNYIYDFQESALVSISPKIETIYTNIPTL